MVSVKISTGSKWVAYSLTATGQPPRQWNYSLKPVKPFKFSFDENAVWMQDSKSFATFYVPIQATGFHDHSLTNYDINSLDGSVKRGHQISSSYSNIIQDELIHKNNHFYTTRWMRKYDAASLPMERRIAVYDSENGTRLSDILVDMPPENEIPTTLSTSPDGSKFALLFQRYHKLNQVETVISQFHLGYQSPYTYEGSEIWIVYKDGRKAKRLGYTKQVCDKLKWTPDGKKVTALFKYTLYSFPVD